MAGRIHGPKNSYSLLHQLCSSIRRKRQAVNSPAESPVNFGVPPGRAAGDGFRGRTYFHVQALVFLRLARLFLTLIK